MYRHLVNKIYHTVVYTLVPIDYVHDCQSATRTDVNVVDVPYWRTLSASMPTDFVYIENWQILYTPSCK